MRVENCEIITARGQRLPARIYRSGDARSGVVFSHGLFSNKDGYKITRLADTITAAGADLLTFDFGYTPEAGGSLSEISILKGVEDLAAAIRFFKERGASSLHLMGSSFGATVTLLYASRCDESIRSLILIAAAVDLHRLFFDAAGIDDPSGLPENGCTPLDGVPLRNAFYREIASLDLLSSIEKIRCPVLAIHGACDTVVDPNNVGLLTARIPSPVRAVFIHDGDHALTRDSDLRLLADEISAWLQGGYAESLRPLTTGGS